MSDHSADVAGTDFANKLSAQLTNVLKREMAKILPQVLDGRVEFDLQKATIVGIAMFVRFVDETVPDAKINIDKIWNDPHLIVTEH